MVIIFSLLNDREINYAFLMPEFNGIFRDFQLILLLLIFLFSSFALVLFSFARLSLIWLLFLRSILETGCNHIYIEKVN